MFARFASVGLAVMACCSLGANYRTQNFIVTASTPQMAKAVGDSAEVFRRDLAIDWLGRELPPWRELCPIQVNIAKLAGGETSFSFRNHEPFGWTMKIFGPPDRMLDSVLPHEITHTIFATHFGRPLPRWADEGACTTVEHASERQKQERFLVQFLTTNRGIAFNHMFAMREYPKDIMPLYSQGYALARFLISQGGKQKYVQFIGEGMDRNNWTAVTRKYYGYESLGELQLTWLEWVRSGTPEPVPAEYVKLQPAANGNALVAANLPANITPNPGANFAVNGMNASYPQQSFVANPTAPPPENLVSRVAGDGWYMKERLAAQQDPHSPQSAANLAVGSALGAATPLALPAAPVTAKPEPTAIAGSALPVDRRQTLLEWKRSAADSNPLRESAPKIEWSGAPAGTIRR